MRVKSRLPPKLRGLVLLLGWLIACAGHGQSQAPEQPSGWTPKKPVVSKHDMVVAANPLAVDAGYAVLREGGNAIDAAIAVQMVLNLSSRNPPASEVARSCSFTTGTIAC